MFLENGTQSCRRSQGRTASASLMRNLSRPIQEILLIYAPFLIHSMNLGPILTRIASPNSTIILTPYITSCNFPLYIYLPTYSFLGILDCSFYFFAITVIWYAIYFMLLVMIRVQEKIQHVIDSLSRR